MVIVVVEVRHVRMLTGRQMRDVWAAPAGDSGLEAGEAGAAIAGGRGGQRVGADGRDCPAARCKPDAHCLGRRAAWSRWAGDGSLCQPISSPHRRMLPPSPPTLQPHRPTPPR
eukprot:7058002-Prymnesium_polylepis.1